MRRTGLIKAANVSLKAALVSGAIGVMVSMLSLFVRHSYYPDLLEPYPTFGVNVRSLYATVAVIYGVIWLAWSGIALWASSYQEGEATIVTVGLVGLLMLVTNFGMACGLECANALLDASPRVRVPVLVRRVRREDETTPKGAASVGIATISPVDQPTRQFDLVWDSCNLSRSTPVSPFAAVRVGRGAFGVPWVELPVECRPLAISDRPLVGKFVLGREPAVVVTLVPTEQSGNLPTPQVERRAHLLMLLDRLEQGEPGWDTDLALSDAREVLSADGEAEFQAIVAPLAVDNSAATSRDIGEAAQRIVEGDSEHRNFGYRLSIWNRAVESAAPGLPVVIIENASARSERMSVFCPRCTIVSSKDVDDDIFELFTGGTEMKLEGDQILLADRAGKLAFKAGLSETSRAAQLASRAKVVMANK
jgi:hypothetical protein